MAPHSLVGKPAPAISLPNQHGETYTFTPGASGAPVCVFFYPKAGSYGCTRQVCQLRDALVDQADFKDSRIELIGISSDSVDQLKSFADKQKVTYNLLSDKDKAVHKAYDVPKGLMGLVDARTTYFIDSEGIIRDVYDATLNWSSHFDFVKDCLEKYSKGSKTETATPTEATTAAEPAPTAQPTTAEALEEVPPAAAVQAPATL